MQVILNTYKNNEHNFTVKVTTANRKVATCVNIETQEVIKFNRSKFEWMISKNIFTLVEQNEAFA
ncbi:MAG: hypothetical protein JKY80_02070 [Mariprofundaceae bacterium]|nr:hypothetical protein [Methylophaga sp.]MBL4759627.1 hypothetical protein [Mariprofundaceae bacterium]